MSFFSGVISRDFLNTKILGLDDVKKSCGIFFFSKHIGHKNIYIKSAVISGVISCGLFKTEILGIEGVSWGVCIGHPDPPRGISDPVSPLSHTTSL